MCLRILQAPAGPMAEAPSAKALAGTRVSGTQRVVGGGEEQRAEQRGTEGEGKNNRPGGANERDWWP